jgi:alpha-glucosidase (family GH31 glycosyl hydrolase)
VDIDDYTDKSSAGRMVPRALERRAFVRGQASAATMRERGENHVTFTTSDAVSDAFTEWEGNDRFEMEATEGTLRIDAVADDVFRIRYAPGPLPERPSRMVVGELDAPSTFEVSADDSTLNVNTGAAMLRVESDPLGITVCDPDGFEVCRIGGAEKNMWSLWDSVPTGVSTTPEGHPLATETYALRPGEAVFGFGEQFGRLEKSGQTIDLNMVEATGTTTPRAYKNIPFFWTTYGYGVLWNTTARATA